MLTAFAVQKNWRLDQYDVKSAYLHSDLKENIYIRQPKGFERKGCEKLYCKLKKSIYGLKQSGRCWNEHLDKELKKAGFNRNGVDPCVYEMNTDCGRAILVVYVDDILVISENSTMQQKVRRELESHFETKYLGPISKLLGVKFNHLKDGSVALSQGEYIDTLLKRFGLQEAKKVSTPMEERPSFLDESDKEPRSRELPFRELIGGLLYLSQRTRPDIAFAVGKLAQYCSNFNEQHWNAAKRILRYLKGTKDNAINYSHSNEPLMAYSDADWASDTCNRKSTTGYVLTLAGSPVIWRSAKQTSVALSSMEAEYVALAECAREVTWVQQFLISLGSQDNTKPVIVQSDRQAAIAHAKNYVDRSRTRHIAIRHHFIRDAVMDKTINLQYVNTSKNVADLLTKPLGLKRCNVHWSRLMGGPAQLKDTK